MLLLYTVPTTDDRIATPNTAPTCRTVFCTADPDPERSGGVASVILVVDGAMVLPRPNPKITPTTIRNHTGASGLTKAKHSMPTRANTRPPGITLRAPNRCTILALRGAPRSWPTANGQDKQAGLQRRPAADDLVVEGQEQQRALHGGERQRDAGQRYRERPDAEQ